ncbi:terminase TerL endonuclease subunit [uncultured Paraglaciecola sp.]|uniref:terminase large subunit n=1 Tax=uncultured Paraglaciecola sp. TaxID=1765024 RepID=UPI00262B277F|nr:terminase TerL endonuclease subunit [uncultured Paraglaciecola sp.]
MSVAEKYTDIRREGLDAAYKYADDVKSGAIPACKYVRLAVDRWFSDLENGGARGLYFDENAAARVIAFFSYLKHSKGKWKGAPIDLMPWQLFVIVNVFGWMREDGRRRFTSVYEEIPRKNGKSTKIAGIGLYGLTSDGEGGAEIYSAATKRDQAKIMFNEAMRMVRQSPELRRLVKSLRSQLEHEDSFSIFQPLGADSDTSDGLNVYFGLVDELHAHKTSEMWDVLESALGAREQPLMWAITTAGFNRAGVCYENRDYAIKVLEGVVDDDSFFGIIYTIDEDDLGRWDQPDVWAKANPNYGVSVSESYLDEKAKKAREIPSAKNNFLTKHLNVWVNAEMPWVDPQVFKRCKADFSHDEMSGTECWGGLDLASVSDLCSLTLAFNVAGKIRLIQKNYLPEDALVEHTRQYNQPFKQWADDGWLTLTPGNVTDYDFIEYDILQWAEQYGIQELAFDRWNSTQLTNHMLEKGVNMVGFGQGFASMSPAMKELERLILSGAIEYDNPVLEWAVSNTVPQHDPAGNIKPAKNKSSGKIDPVVSAIMAVGRATTGEDTSSIDDWLNDPIIL